MQRLRVWESPSLAPGRQKGNLTRGARVAALRLVRGQAGVSGLQTELQDTVGTQGGGKAWHRCHGAGRRCFLG